MSLARFEDKMNIQMNAANVATKMKFENCLSSNKFLGKKELKSFVGLEQIIEFSFELLGKNDFLQVEFLISRIGQNDDLAYCPIVL